MKGTLRTSLAVLLILIITVCSILVVQKLVGSVRVDLTQDELYTLSQGTRNIIGKLNQPVRLRLYYSRTAAMKGPEQIRYYNNYYLYVRSLLEEYVRRSDGLLALSVVDPRAYSDDEEEAIQHGIQRFPLSEDESFFFGLVAQTELGKEDAIGFFEPGRQELVEYDVSRLLTNVTRREMKKVGVLSSLPAMGAEMSPYMMQMMQAQGRMPPRPWTIVTQLRQEYEVVAVQADAESIGNDVDFLMVIHPKDLPEETLFAIDQYVMKGGKLIVFVDPHCVLDQPQQDPQNMWAGMEHETSSGLNDLLRGWGVEMAPKAIATDSRLAVTAAVQRNALPSPIVTYLDLNETCVNPDEPVTAKLHTVRLLFAGALKRVEGAGTDVTPLLETSDVANTWTPENQFELSMFDPETVRRAVSDGTEKLMLACRIGGNLKTNFPDGPPGRDEEEQAAEAEETDEAEPAEPEAAEEAEPAEPEPAEPEEEPVQVVKEADPDAVVLVFADVDMITDMIAYQDTFFGAKSPVGDNAAAVLNSLEFLAGGSDLIDVRSRGLFSRPFKVVEEVERKAEQATAEEVNALNQKIQEYESRLNELHRSGTEEEPGLLESEIIADRRRIEEDIRVARKQLRKLNEGKRQKIEALKAALQTHNMVWAPAGVLLIAILLGVIRHVRAKRYAARRTVG